MEEFNHIRRFESRRVLVCFSIFSDFFFFKFKNTFLMCVVLDSLS